MIKTAKAITDGEMVVAVDGRLIRGRTADAGCKIKHGCHVFHATGTTAYLEAGGTKVPRRWRRTRARGVQ